ncbi:hypothetical protein LTR04_001489 [Oleoguttula sp. CCFEE 6159]|nr:hypothetical protein LTR04_001489 [Oleoguttula sp. CCFEE 6159]
MEAAYAGEEHYVALVDMGSNGIRFSITDVSPSTARIMPTIYQDRAGISLYDAQYSTGQKGPIPDQIIQEVLAALLRFKTVCQDYRVRQGNIQIVATEATREATNSVNFRKQIKDATGWTVTLLAKEEEGRLGAMGIASSFSAVNGLVMDLGGGSTQITWMMMQGGSVTLRPGAVSLPYGAAALSRRLEEADRAGHHAQVELKNEIKQAFVDAYESLDVPKELIHAAKENDGFSLYLSGGGFRGWGYVLMNQHRVNPYPVPIINGFSVSRRDFLDTISVQEAARDEEIFRVSERRAGQVPAVAFLVNALSEALPPIKEVRFCQGGVREGFIFQTLPPSIRILPPLATATLDCAPSSTSALVQLLQSALPQFPYNAPAKHHILAPANHTPTILSTDLLTAFVHALFRHRSFTKETRAAAALRCTTTGFLAGVHGVSHDDRVALALLLFERWGGAVSPTDLGFLDRMERLTSPGTVWWCRYLGRVAQLIAGVYPAGRVEEGRERVGVEAAWVPHLKGKKDAVLGLVVQFGSRRSAESEERRGFGRGDDTANTETQHSEAQKGPETEQAGVGIGIGIGIAQRAVREANEKAFLSLEKLGKKKNWVGGKSGFGIKIQVDVRDGTGAW